MTYHVTDPTTQTTYRVENGRGREVAITPVTGTLRLVRFRLPCGSAVMFHGIVQDVSCSHSQ